MFLIRHRTTGAFLTPENTTTPNVAEADCFASQVAAETILATLEDFATAWRVEPVFGADWTSHYPGAWHHWPSEMRELAARALLAYWLDTFTPVDLVKTLVAARYTKVRAPLPVRYTESADKFWPLLVAIFRYPPFPLETRLPDEPEQPASPADTGTDPDLSA